MFRNLTEKSNNINLKRSLKFANHFILSEKKIHKAHIFKTHCKDMNGSQFLLGAKSQNENICGQTFGTSWGWGEVINDDSSMMKLDICPICHGRHHKQGRELPAKLTYATPHILQGCEKISFPPLSRILPVLESTCEADMRGYIVSESTEERASSWWDTGHMAGWPVWAVWRGCLLDNCHLWEASAAKCLKLHVKNQTLQSKQAKHHNEIRMGVRLGGWERKKNCKNGLCDTRS